MMFPQVYTDDTRDPNDCTVVIWPDGETIGFPTASFAAGAIAGRGFIYLSIDNDTNMGPFIEIGLEIQE